MVSEARTVLMEHWSFFSTVDNVMPSWIRPMVIQTSKFFLSDEREAVEMPLRRENDRPVTHRKLYIHRLDTGAQMIKETHGVGLITFLYFFIQLLRDDIYQLSKYGFY